MPLTKAYTFKNDMLVYQCDSLPLLIRMCLYKPSCCLIASLESPLDNRTQRTLSFGYGDMVLDELGLNPLYEQNDHYLLYLVLKYMR